jgi:Farnesoic acid 0-methyl transferase
LYYSLLSIEFRTADSKDYYFNEVPANSICTLRFRVKTAHDAHICLVSTAAQEAQPILEIFLGGWDNKMSGIRRDRESTDKVLYENYAFFTLADLKNLSIFLFL